jgi:hypothetical protein
MAERAVLAICAAPPAEAQAAWAHWVSGLPAQPTAAMPSYPARLRELQPLLALRQKELGLQGPSWLISRLKTSALLEERRLTAVRTVCEEILNLPVIRDLAPLVVGGLAFGETIYSTRTCRHTSSLRLVLPPDASLRKLKPVLTDRGFQVRQAGWRSFPIPLAGPPRLVARHPSSFPLVIQRGMASPLTHQRVFKAADRVQTAQNLVFLSPALPDAFALAALALRQDLRQSALLWLLDAIYLQRRMDNAHVPDGGLRRPWLELRSLAETIGRWSP